MTTTLITDEDYRDILSMSEVVWVRNSKRWARYLLDEKDQYATDIANDVAMRILDEGESWSEMDQDERWAAVNRVVSNVQAKLSRRTSLAGHDVIWADQEIGTIDGTTRRVWDVLADEPEPEAPEEFTEEDLDELLARFGVELGGAVGRDHLLQVANNHGNVPYAHLPGGKRISSTIQYVAKKAGARG